MSTDAFQVLSFEVEDPKTPGAPFVDDDAPIGREDGTARLVERLGVPALPDREERAPVAVMDRNHIGIRPDDGDAILPDGRAICHAEALELAQNGPPKIGNDGRLVTVIGDNQRVLAENRDANRRADGKLAANLRAANGADEIAVGVKPLDAAVERVGDEDRAVRRHR